MSDTDLKIDPLGKWNFLSLLIERYIEILGKHTKTPGNEFDLDLDNYDINNSVRLKDLIICSLELANYFRELYEIPEYFRIGRSFIEKAYSNNICKANYFAYTYDNFVMRVVTSIDLC